MPDRLYCALVNVREIFRRRQFRLSVMADGESYVGKGPGEGIRIARRNRFKRYDKGIARWIEHLACSYRLDLVPISAGDRIIDCGANIGEIGVWAKQFGAEYHPFEPEEKEAACCDANNFSGEPKTIRKALWFETTELKFFSKPATADGSVIEMNGFEAVKTVQATTLADYISSLDDPSVRLLKVEAEGAEPEVLQGAEGAFQYIDYVSVDCGYERGKDKQPTFSDSNEILRRHNFEVIDANLARPVFLFRRRDLKESGMRRSLAS